MIFPFPVLHCPAMPCSAQPCRSEGSPCLDKAVLTQGGGVVQSDAKKGSARRRAHAALLHCLSPHVMPDPPLPYPQLLCRAMPYLMGPKSGICGALLECHGRPPLRGGAPQSCKCHLLSTKMLQRNFPGSCRSSGTPCPRTLLVCCATPCHALVAPRLPQRSAEKRVATATGPPPTQQKAVNSAGGLLLTTRHHGGGGAAQQSLGGGVHQTECHTGGPPHPWTHPPTHPPTTTPPLK